MTKSNLLTTAMKALNRKFIVALCGAVMCITFTMTHAAHTNNIPEAKRTPQALYLSAREAHDLRKSNQYAVLIDVRTREEAMYLGMPSIADALIPFMQIDERVWDPKTKAFRLVRSDEFESSLNDFLYSRGLDADAVIMLLCREGRRSAKAAKALNLLGYDNVYTVIDGFEGDMAKSGAQRNKRAVNGWKNAGLPWTYELNPEKFFFTE